MASIRLRCYDVIYYLNKIGYEDVVVGKQGIFPAVLASLLKSWAYELEKAEELKQKFRNKLFF